MNYSQGFDILTEEKVQGFWIQTATTDNALPVATIVPKSRPRSVALSGRCGLGSRPKFSVNFTDKCLA
jgi:hypothetical protein